MATVTQADLDRYHKRGMFSHDEYRDMTNDLHINQKQHLQTMYHETKLATLGITMDLTVAETFVAVLVARVRG